MSRHGHVLKDPDPCGIYVCPESGLRYQEAENGTLHCLDLDEESPLPEELAIGNVSYRDVKKT